MKTDRELFDDIIRQFSCDPLLKTTDIRVTVSLGIVTLTGQVDSWFKKTAAENAVKNVDGVRAIAEDIQLSCSPHETKTDTELAETIVDALDWLPAVQEGKIAIKVENGDVRLDGEVTMEYEANNISRVVGNLSGVRSVLNFITVRAKLSAYAIKEKIESAFLRTASVDAANIKVEIADSVVVLTGNVKTFSQMEEAKNAALSFPGVKSIDNKLELAIPENL